MRHISFATLRVRMVLLVVLCVAPALVVILSNAATQRRLAVAAVQSGALPDVGTAAEALAQADAALMRNLAWLGVAFALALAAAWIGSDLFILRKIEALVEAARRVEAGDLKARSGLTYGQGELNQLARAFDAMAEALERREAEVERHARELTAFNTVSASVSSSLDLLEVLESLKRLLADGFGVPGGVIFLYDETRASLYVEAAWGIPPAILAEFKPFPLQAQHYSGVMQKKEALQVVDVRQVEPYGQAGLVLERPQLAGYLCIPLVAKGQLQGVIDLFSPAGASFSREQVVLFTGLGQQVGVAIQNARLYEQVRSGRERLQLLSQQLLHVQEMERRHISRELHDEIGQALTAVKVNLQAMSRVADLSAVKSYMDDSLMVIDRSIGQVRNLSLDLRPSLLDDLGIAAALRWYIDRQAQRGGFEAQFKADPPDMRLPETIETTCFRIVQEALTNVVRHANARHVGVSLRQVDSHLDLSIRDDGNGFDTAWLTGERPVYFQSEEPFDVERGLGLAGMRERAELVGGTVEVISDEGKGTLVWARLPVITTAPGPTVSAGQWVQAAETGAGSDEHRTGPA